MNLLNDIQVNASTAQEYIEACLYSGLVPFIRSSPGCGKSKMVQNIAKKFNLKLIDHRLSTSDSVDLNGLPHFIKKDNGKEIATFAPLDIFPTDLDEIPNGYEGWLLFFDEMNSAPEEIQAACYKIILDRMIGQYHLHSKCVIVCAGNEDTDKAITKELSTAMISRLVHIHMKISYQDWRDNVAIPLEFHPLIISYLERNQTDLLDFEPDNDERAGKPFPCPRTWEMVSNLLKLNGFTVTNKLFPLLAGIIGEGTATKFIGFCQIAKDLIPLEDIIKDPMHAKLPLATDAKWYTIISLLPKATAKNLDSIDIYLNRLKDNSLTVLFYKMLLNKHPDYLMHDVIQRQSENIADYLSKPEKIFKRD